MADGHIVVEELRKQGADFQAYGTELLSLLSSIGEKVDTIAAEGIKGEASSKLLESYEQINGTITAFAERIQDIGGLIISSANAKADYAEQVATAATIN